MAKIIISVLLKQQVSREKYFITIISFAADGLGSALDTSFTGNQFGRSVKE
jgi:hypothetical protein